jgi:phenylacetate-CoA ligase
MANAFFQKLYSQSPVFVQTLAFNAYALRIHKERYGEKYDRVRRELGETQYYSRERMEEYQNRRLVQLVQHAYQTVPYYRDLFDRHGLTSKDIQSKDDIHKIPVLTRDAVRSNRNRLISDKYRPQDLVHGHTSGTTGSPLDFFWDINTCVYTNGVDWRQKNWAGINYGDRIAVLLGRTIVPIDSKRPPFWRMNYLHNQLWLSSFHLREESLHYYVEKLKSYRPAAIEGYPSTVYILARYLLSRNLTLPVKAVLTSSETLYPVQRAAMEAAFGCKVFDFYGLAERVVFATECDQHTGRHLNFEYGLVEIVDDKNRQLPAGRSGFVVSTSLQNFGMPFIRYRTSDVTSIKFRTCTCGREMPLMEEVTTKAEDIVVTPDGRMISPSVLTHPFKPLDTIEKSQILQEDIDRLVIRIVRRPGYTDSDTEKLLHAFRERIGPDVRVDVEFVDDIPRTSSGKFRWVISTVPLPI